MACLKYNHLGWVLIVFIVLLTGTRGGGSTSHLDITGFIDCREWSNDTCRTCLSWFLKGSTEPTGDCFPGFAQVTLPNGSFKAMKDLEVGDQVLSYDFASETWSYQTVYAFLHVNHTQSTLMKEICYETVNTKQCLFASPEHVLFIYRSTKVLNLDDDDQPSQTGHYKTVMTFMTVMAQEVQSGDQLITTSSYANLHDQCGLAYARVVSVQDFVTRAGIYAPLTMSGNLVVNGVVVSCFANPLSHSLNSSSTWFQSAAQVAMFPIKLVYWINPWSGKPKERIHPWANFLFHLVDLYVLVIMLVCIVLEIRK